MKKTKENKGITLIALVITIIVMLILVAVTINVTTGDNGLFGKARDAASRTNAASASEQAYANNIVSRIDTIVGNSSVSSGNSAGNSAGSEDYAFSVTVSNEYFATGGNPIGISGNGGVPVRNISEGGTHYIESTLYVESVRVPTHPSKVIQAITSTGTFKRLPNNNPNYNASYTPGGLSNGANYNISVLDTPVYSIEFVFTQEAKNLFALYANGIDLNHTEFDSDILKYTEITNFYFVDNSFLEITVQEGEQSIVVSCDSNETTQTFAPGTIRGQFNLPSQDGITVTVDVAN